MTSLTVPTPAEYLGCFPELSKDVQAAIEELSHPFPGEEIQVRQEGLPEKYHNQSMLTAEIKAGKNVIDFALEK